MLRKHMTYNLKCVHAQCNVDDDDGYVRSIDGSDLPCSGLEIVLAAMQMADES
jgi:hypothetical protein